MRPMRRRWPALIVIVAMLAGCGGTPTPVEDGTSSSQSSAAAADGRDDGAGSTGDEADQAHVLTTTLNLGSEGAAEDPWCTDDLGPYRLTITSDRGTDPSLAVRLDNSVGTAVASTVELDVAISISEQRGSQGRESGEKLSLGSPTVTWAQPASATRPDALHALALPSVGTLPTAAAMTLSALATSTEPTDDDAGADTGAVDAEPTTAPQPPGDDDAQTNGDGSSTDGGAEPEEPSTMPLAIGALVADGHGTCSFTSTPNEAVARCTFDAPAQGDARSVIVALQHPKPEPHPLPDVNIALSMRLR
jgi:hypothetical protein